jgi:hypothetical protein
VKQPDPKIRVYADSSPSWWERSSADALRHPFNSQSDRDRSPGQSNRAAISLRTTSGRSPPGQLPEDELHLAPSRAWEPTNWPDRESARTSYALIPRSSPPPGGPGRGGETRGTPRASALQGGALSCRCAWIELYLDLYSDLSGE